MKRIIVMIIASCLLSSLVLTTGCSEDGKTTGTDETTTVDNNTTKGSELNTGYVFDREKEYTLNVYTEFFGPPRKPLLEGFQEKYPMVSVDPEPVDIDKMTEKITADTAAGEQIDIFTYKDIWLPDFVHSNLVYPLDEHIEKDKGALNHILDNTFRTSRINGKLYMVPTSVMYYSTVYNKDLFDWVGVPYPQDDWTKDEFLNTLVEMSKHDGENTYVGIDLHVGKNDFWASMYGAEPIKYNPEDGSWDVDFENDEAFVQAVEECVDLMTNFGVYLTIREEKELGLPPGRDQGGRWRSGRFAIGSHGPHAYNATFHDAFEVGFVMPPKPAEGEPHQFAQIYGWCMHPQGKDNDAAWEAIKWFSSDECQRLTPQWMTQDSKRLMGTFVSNKSFYNEMPEKYADIITQYMRIADITHPKTEYYDTSYHIREISKDIVNNGTDLATAIKDMQVHVDSVLNPTN